MTFTDWFAPAPTVKRITERPDDIGEGPRIGGTYGVPGNNIMCSRVSVQGVPCICQQSAHSSHSWGSR